MSKRPFDVVGAVGGTPVAIELKARSLKEIQPHQEAALFLFAAAGGVACAVVKNTVYRYSMSDRAFNEVGTWPKYFTDLS